MTKNNIYIELAGLSDEQYINKINKKIELFNPIVLYDRDQYINCIRELKKDP